MVEKSKAARARVRQEPPAATQGRFLVGMKEICKYVSRSEATVIGWIEKEDFPAKRIGHIWEAPVCKVDEWRMKKWEEAPPQVRKRDRGVSA